MDLWEALMIAFRRWYVVIPVLAVGLVLGQLVADSVSPVYQADAVVQYRVPVVDQNDEEAVAGVNTNPYTNLNTLISATEVASQSDVIAIEMANAGFGDVAYSLASDLRSPLLTIQTESTSYDRSIAALDTLVEFVQQDAVERQNNAGVDDEYHVQLEVLDQDLVPTTDLTSRTRTRVLMIAVAFILAIVVAVGIESLLNHLRRRRESQDDVAEEQPGVVWFGLPVSGGQPVQPPPQQLTAISGGSDWREDRVSDAAGEPSGEDDDLRPTGSEKRRTRWAR